MKIPEASDCARSARLGTARSLWREQLRPGGGELLRPHDEPFAVLQLLYLVEASAGHVIARRLPAQRADDRIDRMLLQPGRERLVLDAFGAVDRRLERLPGGEGARRLQLDRVVRQAGLGGALVVRLHEGGGDRVVGERRVLLERGER